MNTTNSFYATWDLYGQAWSKVSPAERRALLDRSVAAQFVYTDPLQQCHGQEELAVAMGKFQEMMPGASFTLTGFEVHHDQALVSWNLVDASGTAVSSGQSFGRYDANGLIVQATGFFDAQKFLDSL